MISRCLLLVFGLLAFTASAGTTTFAQVVAALREQGRALVYSSALIHPSTVLATSQPVPQLNLAALERLLQPLQLGVRRFGDLWVVVRRPADETGGASAEADFYPLPLETLIVTGSLHRIRDDNPGSSVQHLRAGDLQITPGASSDPLRASLRVPGVASVGVSAKPRIRGGLQDELLVMQDGVELLEPFHLSDYHSAYSSIDYHTIESIDFYTGGFPARYGNRISGVMDIVHSAPASDYHYQLGISTFTRFFNSAHELDGERGGDWQLSLRSGDLSDLTDYIQSRAGKPRYRDAIAQLHLPLADDWRLHLGASYAEDDIVFDDEEESASSEVRNRLAWARLAWSAGRSQHRLTLSGAQLLRDKRLQSRDEDGETKGGLLDHHQRVSRFALRHDIARLYTDLALELGWQAELQRANYRHQSRIDRGDLADLLGTQREVERDLQAAAKGWSGGGYLQAEWNATPALVLQPSLRWDFQDYYRSRGLRQQLAPRLGLRYRLGRDTFVRASGGRFYQPEAVQELQILDGETGFFVPQRADQWIVGISHDGKPWRLVADAYVKRYRRPKDRFENVFNPFVLLPEMEPDRIRLSPARATTSGVDLLLGYRWNPAWDSDLRYSYLDARDHINGRRIPRRWSQRHTLQGSVTWQGNDFSVSLAALWHSGWRSSRPPAELDGSGRLLDWLNNVELREHFSLDLSLRRQWRFSSSQLEAFVDISNLTRRHNPAGIDFDLEEPGDNRYQLLPDHETLLGRVVAMGVILSF